VYEILFYVQVEDDPCQFQIFQGVNPVASSFYAREATAGEAEVEAIDPGYCILALNAGDVITIRNVAGTSATLHNDAPLTAMNASVLIHRLV